MLVFAGCAWYNIKMLRKLVPEIPNACSKENAARITPTALSFVGDAVQTLYVRAKLVCSSDAKTGLLHVLAAKEVNATAQAHAVKRMEAVLTEEEAGVYKRCRNAKQNTMAKHASAVDYKLASGLEGLLGYLYLTGNSERAEELLTYAYDDVQGSENSTTES